MHIGIDLDNTIIDYEHAFGVAAAAMGLTAIDGLGKTALRDRIVAHAGDEQWQQIQAVVYGPLIGDARPYAGAASFFERARARGIALTIVSHKSVYAAAAPHGTNLRDAARAWLARNAFVTDGEPPVYFESTRREKCERIARLGCTIFIDDLVEVFADPAFPSGVERWLFAPAGAAQTASADRTFGSWDAVRAAAGL